MKNKTEKAIIGIHKKRNALRNDLFEAIDFVVEEQDPTYPELFSSLTSILNSYSSLMLRDMDEGRILRPNIMVCICGEEMVKIRRKIICPKCG